MTFLTLDIETVPQAPFVDPSNYSFARPLAVETGGRIEMVEQVTAGKLGLRLAEDFLLSHQGGIVDAIQCGDAQLEETNVVPALHPTTCHIVQVSFGWRNPDGLLCRDVLQSDQYAGAGPQALGLAAAAEYALVTAALHRIAGACQKGTTLVSFNGKQFDIPTLRARAAILEVSAPPLPWRRILYPYSDKEHADLRLVLGADNRYARGTLQWWADTMGIHAEEHGRHVFGWVWRDKWDTLSDYGMTEAQTLVELYERVRGVL